MSQQDLANYLRLEAEFDESSNIDTHIIHRSDPRAGQRRLRCEEKWRREKFLGQGASGSVWLEVKADSKRELRAVKRINKSPGRVIDFNPLDEVTVNFILSRPENAGYFVSFSGWYETYNSICLVMEYLEHGDLEHHLSREGSLREDDVKTIGRQLVEGLSVIHSANLVHRDLKPGIGDFGISRRMEALSTITFTGAGTSGYAAPEVIFNERTRQTRAIDMWSLGSVIYRSLMDRLPFSSRREIEIFRKDSDPFYGHIESITILTRPAKDFLQSVFIADPHERITVHTAGKHEWLTADSNVDLIVDTIVDSPIEDVTQRTTTPQDRITIDDSIDTRDLLQEYIVPGSGPYNGSARSRQQTALDKMSTPAERGEPTVDTWSTLSQLEIVRTLSNNSAVAIATPGFSSSSSSENSTISSVSKGLVRRSPHQQTERIRKRIHVAMDDLTAITSRCERYGRTKHEALLYSAYKGDVEVTQLLLIEEVDVEISEPFGLTPLYIASYLGHTMIVQLLIDWGANPSTPNRNGHTPLYIAAQSGHDQIVRLLLDSGANPCTFHKEGDTPLYTAAQNGHDHIVQLLSDKGVDVSFPGKNGCTPLYIAAYKGHLRTVQLLLDKGADSAIRDKDGCTPLHMAAFNGHHKIVQLLLVYGADLTTADNDGFTPLYGASSYGYLQVVEILLHRHGDPNVTSTSGHTPLQVATQNGHYQMVKLLLNHGADPRLRSRKNVSASDIAKHNENTHIYQILDERCRELACESSEVPSGD